MRRLRLLVPLLLLAGTILRFALAIAAADDELRADERHRYLPIAESLREGGGFAIEGSPTAQVMPLWPLLLSTLPSGFPPRLLSALLSAAALPLAWLLARRLAGPRAALLTLALLAVDLDQATLAGTVLAEPLFTLLLLGFAVAWSGRWLVPAAAMLGLSVLARPEAFLLPFLFALWTREWRRPLLLLAGVVVALAPWAVRNARALDAFVPFTTTGGITLHSGMNEAEADLPLRKAGQGRGHRYRHARALAARGEEVPYDRRMAREAIAFALSHPGAALRLTAAKAVLLWTPIQRKGKSFAYALAVLLVWWAWWRRVRLPVPLVGPLLLAMTLVGLVFLAIPRYHAPYHPYLFLLAAAGLTSRPTHGDDGS